MIFRTSRLEVREFLMSDLDSFFAMQSDINVMRYIKPALSYEEAKAELKILINFYSDPNKFYCLWAVTQLDDGRLIGLCGIYQNKQSNFEIAYRLIPSAWGRRYGSEVAEALITHSMRTLNLKSIVAHAQSENLVSCKILAKHMSFVEEKTDKLTGIKSKKYKLDNTT